MNKQQPAVSEHPRRIDFHARVLYQWYNRRQHMYQDLFQAIRSALACLRGMHRSSPAEGNTDATARALFRRAPRVPEKIGPAWMTIPDLQCFATPSRRGSRCAPLLAA